MRLLRSYREVQIIVLKNIVSVAQKNQAMFQAHQKSFYVHSNDSIQVKLLKLEILTILANEANISVLLREFQAYVLSHDKEFAAASINAIGRCASQIKEVADSCLSGLVNLMSKKDETIVAESVVVIKRLLQQNPAKNGHIIKKMAKMAEKVTVPMARASIIWLIGEYSDRISKIAVDHLPGIDEHVVVEKERGGPAAGVAGKRGRQRMAARPRRLARQRSAGRAGRAAGADLSGAAGRPV